MVVLVLVSGSVAVVMVVVLLSAMVVVLDGGSALSGNALCGNVDSGGSVAVVMVVVVLLAAVVVVLDGGSVPLKSVSTTRTPNKPRRISSGSYSHSYSFLCRVPGKRERRLRSL